MSFQPTLLSERHDNNQVHVSIQSYLLKNSQALHRQGRVHDSVQRDEPLLIKKLQQNIQTESKLKKKFVKVLQILPGRFV